MTQQERILAYLRDGHTLTTMYAFRTWGMTCAGQRVSDLIRDGWQIDRAKASNGPHFEYRLKHCTGCTDGEFFGAHQVGTFEHSEVFETEAR